MPDKIKVEKPLAVYNRLTLDLDEIYGKAAKHFGISDSTLMILYVLLVTKHPSQADIVRLCGIPKQTIGTALKKMEQDEILQLVPGKGKRKEVCLTDKGRKLADQTAGKVIACEQRAFLEMKEEDRKEFFRLNELFNQCLKKEMEEMKNGNQTL